MGRPRAVIDWEAVDDMLMKDIGATTIVRRLGIKAEDTLYRACKRDHKMDFSEYRQKKLAEGADELKETAYDMAIRDKDKTLLIFMLKNRAGYADRTITDNTHHLPEETAKAVESLVEKTAKAKKELDDERGDDPAE